MKRFLWGLLLVLLMAVGGGAWWAYHSRDALIASAIRTYGPQIAGVPVELSSVRLDPAQGTAVLQGLQLGNPKGFKTPSALRVDQVLLDLDVATLTSNVVHIRHVSILQPEVTYEHASGGSNLDVIQRNVEATLSNLGVGGGGAQTDKAAGNGKKLIIDRFDILGAKAEVSATVLEGKTVTVSLTDVHLSDMGKKAGGISPAQATSQVLVAVRQAVTSAVTPLHLDGVVDAVKKGAASVVDSVKGFFK